MSGRNAERHGEARNGEASENNIIEDDFVECATVNDGLPTFNTSRVSELRTMVKEHNDNVSKLLLSSKDTLDRRTQIELAFRECKEAFLELSAGYLLLLENRKSASSLSSEVKNFVSNTVSKKLDSLLSRTTDYCKNCKNSNNGSVSRGSMPQSADKRSYASVVDSDPSRIRMARGHTLNISKSTNLIITPSAGKTEISSSSDTRNAVQRILKPSEFDLKVKRISATRNNGVRIEAHSVDLDKIKDSRVLEKAGLTLAQESKINPRVLIHGVPCHMTREDIKSDIIALNLRDVSSTELAQVRVVYLFPEKEGRKTTNCVMEVTPHIRSLLLSDKHVYVNYYACRVSDYVKVLQCFKCLAFGHFAKNCKSTPLCGHCAKPHETKECTKRKESPVCGNCRRWTSQVAPQHSALDGKSCPILRKRITDRINSINYG